MSIPKIYALGHRHTNGIFDGPVVIQEKIDGSQFSFGVTDGRLWCRSKSTELNLADPGMFNLAVATASRLFHYGQLSEGVSYQCEYLAKPKHNVLAYSRVPANNLVLFDVKGPTEYLFPGGVAYVAISFGLEPVPVLFEGTIDSGFRRLKCDDFLMNNVESVLGGQKIEGIVIKNYGKEHPESPGHPMTAKMVSPQFKERAAHAPRNPKACGDVVQGIINSLRTEARWLKVVQHLRDAGKLVNRPEDIGPLMRELYDDLIVEDMDFIAKNLIDGYLKEIVRGVQNGFPQWYQKVLAAGGLSVFQQQNLVTPNGKAGLQSVDARLEPSEPCGGSSPS